MRSKVKTKISKADVCRCTPKPVVKIENHTLKPPPPRYPLGRMRVRSVRPTETHSVATNFVFGAEHMDYTVQSGDTLLRIANSYGTIPSNVVTPGGSHLDPYSLIPGQTLVVLPEYHVIVEGDTLVSLAKKYKTTSERISAANPELQGSLKMGQRVRLA